MIWKRSAVQQPWPFRVSYAHDISHSCLLHPHPYAMPMSLWPRRLCTIFYFARWKGHLEHMRCLVCHSHTPTRSVSSLWALADSVPCLLFLISIKPRLFPSCERGNSVFIYWPVFGERWGGCWLFYGIFLHLVTLRQMQDGFQPQRMRWGDGSLTYQVLFLLFELSATLACRTPCKYSADTLSQQCLVSTLPINNSKSRCSYYGRVVCIAPSLPGPTPFVG